MGAAPSFPVVALSRERVVVVTGANTGLGYETAKWTAMMGATVVIGCRSEERALQAIEKMNSEYEAEKEKWKEDEKINIPMYDSLAVEYMPLDLASFKSVTEFVEMFKSRGHPLHVLICNAGIGMAPFEKTSDGYEKMLQVNYLGHFLLAAKLLPLMRGSGPDCRLLFVSSEAHRFCKFDLTTMNYDGLSARFTRMDYYGRSKLYQIMQMSCMTRRLKGSSVTVNAIHPGIVDTEISRSYQESKLLKGALIAVKLFGVAKKPLEGATSIINAAVNPVLVGVGDMYYKDCKDGYRTSASKDKGKQEALWTHTLDLLKDLITDEELGCLEGMDIVPETATL